MNRRKFFGLLAGAAAATVAVPAIAATETCTPSIGQQYGRRWDDEDDLADELEDHVALEAAPLNRPLTEFEQAYQRYALNQIKQNLKFSELIGTNPQS